MAMVLLALVPAGRVEAHPRMISYGFTNCVSCHVSPQGRGLLKGYGRGIDMEQSLSDTDHTGRFVAWLLRDPSYGEGDWDGQFGPILADFLTTTRINHEFDTNKTDPTFSALFRQAVLFGKKQNFRVSYEVGFRDTDLNDTRLGPNLTATGGSTVFLKKATVEWRVSGGGAKGGSEVVIGRDYLPLGLQLDDYSSYLLHLNRDGIYDYPIQAKYFTWTEKSLASVYAYGPTFDEPGSRREYGGGFLYERYPTEQLALGVQSLMGFAQESNRWRTGAYARWGISRKWTLFAEADFTYFWDAGPAGQEGNQITGFLQLYYHHYEWLVSSVTGSYAHSRLFLSDEDHFSGRYTLSARITRNLTLGLTFGIGDIRRNLEHGEEGAIFANLKF